MSQFKREHRYVVLKVKDLKQLSPEGQKALSALCDEVAQIREQRGRGPFDSVVVEESWPEYETVWAMIQARIEGEAADE